MKILTLGSDVLRQKAVPVNQVDDDIRALIAEMFAAMDAQNGVGLAAPQVGRLLRLFVVRAADGVPRVFINPHITAMSGDLEAAEEGCLSIPGVYGDVTRPKSITVQATDAAGRKFVLEAEGHLARIIQHENDHLDGILYIDRAGDGFRDKATALFKKREERRKQKSAQKKAKAASLSAKIAAKQEKKWKGED